MAQINDYNISEVFTDSELADIILLRHKGKTWQQVADAIKAKYSIEKSADSVRKIHVKYHNLFDISDDKVFVKQLQEIARVKQTNSKTVRDNKKLLQALNDREDLLEDIRSLVQSTRMEPMVVTHNERDPAKRDLTLEALISDVHVGKKTDTFNLAVCRKRLRKFTQAFVDEIDRNRPIYNIDRLVVALLGDIIESYTMHGLESARACEFGNSRQVQEAIAVLWSELIAPLAQLGIPMTVPCVTGNHDRTESNRTYNNPGEENLTWIIYKTLEMLAVAHNLAHVEFIIPTGPYIVMNIYKNRVLYEHGDNSRMLTRAALEKLMSDRMMQSKGVLDFMRVGHYHEYSVFGRGKIIVNGSVPGQDPYADVNGFQSEPLQVINLYVDTNNRPTCFYKSFPVSLE